MTNMDRAMILLRKTLECQCAGSPYLYRNAFYAGQVSKVIKTPVSIWFNEFRAAFLMGIEGTADAELAAPDRLPLYLEDVTAGLANGAKFPLNRVHEGQTIKDLNPLAVVWHEFPPWFVALMRRVYGKQTHPLTGFSRIRAGIPGIDTPGSVFDHWGRTGNLLVTEPYDYHSSDGDTLKAFCAKIGANFRLAPVPFHHQKTQRIEIFSKGNK